MDPMEARLKRMGAKDSSKGDVKKSVQKLVKEGMPGKRSATAPQITAEGRRLTGQTGTEDQSPKIFRDRKGENPYNG